MSNKPIQPAATAGSKTKRAETTPITSPTGTKADRTSGSSAGTTAQARPGITTEPLRLLGKIEAQMSALRTAIEAPAGSASSPDAESHDSSSKC